MQSRNKETEDSDNLINEHMESTIRASSDKVFHRDTVKGTKDEKRND